MTHVDILDKIISNCEEHLDQAIDYGSFEKRVSYSFAHLNVFFKAITGLTIPKYHRRRRLSEAAKSIKTTNATILEIAEMYGYTHDGLTNAFKTNFAILPSDYRNSDVDINLQDKIDPSIYDYIDYLPPNKPIHEYNRIMDDINNRLTRIKLAGIFDDYTIRKDINTIEIDVNPEGLYNYIKNLPEIQLPALKYWPDFVHDTSHREQLKTILAVLYKGQKMGVNILPQVIRIDLAELGTIISTIDTYYDLDNPVLDGYIYYYRVKQEIINDLKSLISKNKPGRD